MKKSLALLILLGSILLVGCQGGTTDDEASKGAGLNQGNDAERGKSAGADAKDAVLN